MSRVVIVGGGPVGLAAAIEARITGLDATVIEPRAGSIDKACGEGLMPGAIPALARLGVQPRGIELRGIDYRDGRRSAQHRFREGHALGVRRTTLHTALRERAEELGVQTVAARVEDLAQDDHGVVAAGVAGDWLIGADGLHSTVARLAGLELPGRAGARRYGQRRHYWIDPWSDLIEVHWNRVGEIYVTPTADGMVGLSLLARQGVRFDEALAASPELARRIAGAEPASELRGAGPFQQRRRARVSGRILLVGDASGYVDALTGEGIRIGLAQARAAVAAIVGGDPRSYERAWGEVTRDFRRLTGALVRVATSPARPLIVPVARVLPALYAGAVERIAR